MLYAKRHRPRGVGLAGAVYRTWAVAEKNDWQFSNPRIDTDEYTRCQFAERKAVSDGFFPSVFSCKFFHRVLLFNTYPSEM